MTALIPVFIAALPSLLKAGEAAVAFVKSFREAAKQDDVWTDGHEAQFQDELRAAGLEDWSKTDAELGK